MKKIHFMMRVFTMVLTGVVFAVAVFTMVINPTETVETKLFWQMPLVSALCTLTSLIYPWNREMSKKEIIVKTLIHYLLINAIVLGGGALFYWYDPSQVRNIAAMVLAITLIFGVVTAISWRKSAADAARMNEKLEEYQKKMQECSQTR
ncbi:MAG: DUF3021 domain-containing protein [Acetatifactor sp.]